MQYNKWSIFTLIVQWLAKWLALNIWHYLSTWYIGFIKSHFPFLAQALSPPAQPPMMPCHPDLFCNLQFCHNQPVYPSVNHISRWRRKKWYHVTLTKKKPKSFFINTLCHLNPSFGILSLLQPFRVFSPPPPLNDGLSTPPGSTS